MGTDRHVGVTHLIRAIELKITDAGLHYIGHDYNCPSGGAYMAGFQSFADFARDGGINEMPNAIAGTVRARLADRSGGTFRVTIRVDGAAPRTRPTSSSTASRSCAAKARSCLTARYYPAAIE